MSRDSVPMTAGVVSFRATLRPSGAATAPTGASVPVPAGARPVWVSEAMIDLYGTRVGGTLTLPLNGKPRQFFELQRLRAARRGDAGGGQRGGRGTPAWRGERRRSYESCASEGTRPGK